MVYEKPEIGLLGDAAVLIQSSKPVNSDPGGASPGINPNELSD
jgi:hypothetical protein